MQKALDCEYQLVVLDASLSNEKLSQIEIFSAYIEFWLLVFYRLLFPYTIFTVNLRIQSFKYLQPPIDLPSSVHRHSETQ